MREQHICPPISFPLSEWARYGSLWDPGSPLGQSRGTLTSDRFMGFWTCWKAICLESRVQISVSIRATPRAWAMLPHAPLLIYRSDMTWKYTSLQGLRYLLSSCRFTQWDVVWALWFMHICKMCCPSLLVLIRSAWNTIKFGFDCRYITTITFRRVSNVIISHSNAWGIISKIKAHDTVIGN